MRNRFTATIFQVWFFALIFGLACLTVNSQESNAAFSINQSPLGAPTSPVMDYVGVIDAATKQELERKIIAFRDSTNPRVELAVAVVATTGERPIFDYSLAVARGWKIGSPEQDNPSALLFIAVNDRKYFTQVSKDLEDELPDGLVGQLQRQNLVPAFRQQNYGKGINDTIDAYIRTIQSKGNGTGEPPVTGTTNQPREKKSSVSLCSIGICLIFVFFVILPLLGRLGNSNKRRGKDDHWRGGGFGGGGAASALPWVIGSIIANSGSSSSSSGWGGGGSSSGGGDSWGGFGGGGDFGGGGAGGDW